MLTSPAEIKAAQWRRVPKPWLNSTCASGSVGSVTSQRAGEVARGRQAGQAGGVVDRVDDGACCHFRGQAADQRQVARPAHTCGEGEEGVTIVRRVDRVDATRQA